MVTYHIYFRNNYSQGASTQDYTVWRKTPTVNSAVRVFSNAFLTRNVTSGGNWSIDINDIPYAYCGTSSRRPLSLGEIPNVTGQKLVKILPSGNGSTVSVYNNQGRPAFRPDVQYTSGSGTYQVVTDPDFTPNLKFVAGHSGNDGDGISRPFATFEIEPSSTYPVRPSACFYLGDFHSSPGALVSEALAPHLATIDFDAYPGQTNAVVTQDASGNFDVQFVTAAVFAMTVASSEPVTSSNNVQLTQLKTQAKMLNDMIDAALGISTTNVSIGSFKCSLQWINQPSLGEQQLVTALLKRSMTQKGYSVKDSSVEPMNVVVWHTPDQTVRRVLLDWVTCIAVLPPMLQNFVKNPFVERLLLGPAVTAQAESLSLPADVDVLPRPQWSCSLKWLEGPSEATKEEIGAQLVDFMIDHEYVTWPPTITDETITIQVYYYGPSAIESVQGDWRAAYRSLEFLSMYVTDPQVEPVFSTQNPSSTETNEATKDESSLKTGVFMLPTFRGTVTWIGNPSDDTRKTIVLKIILYLGTKNCRIQRSDPHGGSVVWNHYVPYDVGEANRQWAAACVLPHDPDLRKWFHSNRCTPASSMTNAGASTDDFRPPNPNYVGLLTWLEGAPPQTRDAIISIMMGYLLSQGNSIVSVDKVSPELKIFFSHPVPSNLATATTDWMNAYNKIEGNLRMFVTNPRCEDAYTTQKSDEVASSEVVLPVVSSYIGSLDWLEGPNQQSKDSIIEQLTTTLVQRGNKIENIIDLTGADKLCVAFSHGQTNIERATADWMAAYESVNDFQRMFITNPQCTVDDDVSTQADISISNGYLGSLHWLEGPGQPAKDSIISQLKNYLQKNGYNAAKVIDFPEFLVVPFYHIKPWSLEDAQKDWQAAFNSIQGNQRMFITNPSCEEDKPVHTTGADQATNGTDGAEQVSGLAAAAPEAEPAREEESLESKKRRALALLEREGLIGFGSIGA